MRPVNLIPGDQRRGTRGLGPRRLGSGGIAAYGFLGLLGLVLVGVLALVLTSNRINDRKSTIASLQSEEAGARATAETLRPYGNFAQLQRTRVDTVNSLVDTAFNWERVLRQVSRTIPSDAWLTSLTATVEPGVKVGSGGSGGAADLRSRASHPAVELSGCTYSHRAVARMMTRMRNLDDVTEVALANSERPSGKPEEGGGESSEGDGGGSDCRTKYRITKFDIVVVLGESKVAQPAAVAAGSAVTPVARAQGAVTTANQQSAGTAGAGE